MFQQKKISFITLILSLILSAHSALAYDYENDLTPKAYDYINQGKLNEAFELANKAESQLQKEFDEFKNEKVKLEELCQNEKRSRKKTATKNFSKQESESCGALHDLSHKKENLIDRRKNIDSLFGKIYITKGEYQQAEKFYLSQIENKNDRGFCAIDTGVYFDLLDLYALTSNLTEAKKLIWKVQSAIECERRETQQDLYMPWEEACRDEEYPRNEQKRCEEQIQKARGRLDNAYYNSLTRLYLDAGFLSYQEGDFLQSETNYQKAFDYASKTQNPEAMQRSIQQNQALLYKDMGRYPEAEKLLDRVLQLHRKNQDSHNEAIALGTLASLYFAKGDYRQSIRTYETCLQLKASVFGPRHPALAYTYNNFAEVYRDLHQFEKAEGMYRLAKELWSQGKNDDLLKSAVVDNNLAEIKRLQGKLSEAETLYQSSYRNLSSILTATSPLIAEFNDNFAQFYRAQGQLEKAESYALSALKIRDSLPQHFLVYKTLWHLGQIYQDQNKLALAETFYENAEKQLTTLTKKKHPDLGRIFLDQATNFTKQKENKKAEEKFNQAISILEKDLPAGHPDIVDALTQQINFLKESGLSQKTSTLEKKLSLHQEAGKEWQ